MTCYKTGAQVYFQNYGYSVPADLYSVGNTVVIRFNAEGRVWKALDNSVSHIVAQIDNSDDWFMREDLGICVVHDAEVWHYDDWVFHN